MSAIFLVSSTKGLPDCWGHRGASAAFPENTLASFEAAMRDGAEGIESDVHVSVDDVVLMFHDPGLERTTNGKGLIREQAWYGENGMEHVRTVKEPKQAIPTFAETVELLMKPENQHVRFNVDVKVQNDPDRTFSLMHKIISAHDGWETLLAPRILLGLWHPQFLPAAKTHLPYLRRSYIGASLIAARKYFWNDCEAFSMNFNILTMADGEKFRDECKQAGKKIMVWTVNKPEHMVEATRWKVDAILTDFTKVWLDLRSAIESDGQVASRYSRTFLWTSIGFYRPYILWRQLLLQAYLETVGGPFDKKDGPVKPKAVKAN